MPVPDPNPRIYVDIVYHDHDLIVVNKPAGLVTQPGKGHPRDSLLNGLFALFENLLINLGEKRDWGLLHRLDKDTSGLLVVALKPLAYDRLREKFEARHVDKVYLAVVRGTPKPAQGVCQATLHETRQNGKKVSVVSREGQQAITAWRTLSAAGNHALLECRIKTGRLHQIRAHLAHLGWPVVGDDLYPLHAKHHSHASALLLHAWRLKFGHPIQPITVDVKAPPPEDFVRGVGRLGLTLPV